MAHQVLAVTFEVDAQNARDGQFSMPKVVCDILKLKEEDRVRPIFDTPSGEQVSRDKQLKSGLEIYDTKNDPDLREFIKAGERITVTASRLD
jgi:hypothetical protein